MGKHRRGVSRPEVLSVFDGLRAPESRALHDHKGAEGKRRRALVAFARREVAALWTMIRECKAFGSSLTA